MGLVQFGIGNLGSVRVDAPTKAGAALKGIEVSIDIARWRETAQTQGRLALTLAFGLDWSRLTQPVGTLLVSLALVRRDASLLPHLVRAVIELLSGRTLALLSSENAVVQLANEIKGRIVDANFVIPTLPSRIHGFIQSACFEVSGANFAFPTADQRERRAQIGEGRQCKDDRE